MAACSSHQEQVSDRPRPFLKHAAGKGPFDRPFHGPRVSVCLARRGFIMGVWNSHTSVGNILGSLIAGVYVSSAWGMSFIVPGLIIASTGVICFFFLVESKSVVDGEWLFDVLRRDHLAQPAHLGPSAYKREVSLRASAPLCLVPSLSSRTRGRQLLPSSAQRE